MAADAAPPGVPGVEVAQLDAQDGGLDAVEAGVAAVGDHVLVLAGVAVVGEQPDAARDLLAVRHQGAAVAHRAEIFGRVEAEAGRVADASDAAALSLHVAPGAVCLRGVLDEGRAVPAGQRQQAIEIGRMAVQVNGDDRLDLLAIEGARGCVDIDGEVALVDVDENGLRSDAHDRFDRGREGKGHGQDAVAGADAERSQRQLQGVAAVAQADGAAHADEGGELAFEELHLLAADERGARDDAGDRLVDLRLQLAVVGGEIDERNGHGGSSIRRVRGESGGAGQARAAARLYFIGGWYSTSMV